MNRHGLNVSSQPGLVGTRVPHRDGCTCPNTDEPAVMMSEYSLPGFFGHEALTLMAKLVQSRAIEPVFYYRRERYNAEGNRIGPDLAIRSCEHATILAAVDAFRNVIESI